MEEAQKLILQERIDILPAFHHRRPQVVCDILFQATAYTSNGVENRLVNQNLII